MVSSYTKEAWVRNLEREIARVCRKVAFKKGQGEKTGDAVTPDALREYLGPERFFPEVAMRTSRPGVATGLDRGRRRYPLRRGDVEHIGEELREGLEFVFVESADEVFQLALTDSTGETKASTGHTKGSP